LIERGASDPKEERLAEAAAWRIHLTEIGADSSIGFEAWLQDPANAQAWASVSRGWDLFGLQAHDRELIRARQAALGGAKRVGLNPSHSMQLLKVMAAALLVGTMAWGGMQWLRRPDDYSTALGERRVVTLTDGSRISLDSGSEVTVQYSKNARELHLLRGQARFDVTHDVERPFSVEAGNQKVIATGTAFNIDLSGQKVFVTLIEGHVVVVDEDDGAVLKASHRIWPKSTELTAGQELAAAPSAVPEVAKADIQRVTAWTNGQIMFDNETLSSLVARVNRYSATRIVIADPRIAAMRISGVLNAGDVNGFVDIVTHYLSVRASTNSDGTISLAGDGKITTSTKND
jgi:transmembrane sensor